MFNMLCNNGGRAPMVHSCKILHRVRPPRLNDEVGQALTQV
jgi:hypothetical protein